MLILSPKIPKPGMGQIKVRSWKVRLGLPFRWQGFHPMSFHLLLLTVCVSSKLELEAAGA